MPRWIATIMRSFISVKPNYMKSALNHVFCCSFTHNTLLFC
ncbi:hypothetical protein CPter91_3781 [Collimonas pratensis]|uniref:Uncharacterized protein n=1 Tax=Collimonas pratensis TaxID=279113 RepID=A0A127Q916_9BURK|nr:hypothetical protein CPter91_3781 [Collimonas pratensis]